MLKILSLFNNKVILNYILILDLDYLLTRENDGTERDAQGVGRDVLCSRKICLTQWRSRFSGGSLFSETSAAVLPRSKVLKDTLSAIT